MSKMSNLALVLGEVKQKMCDEYCHIPHIAKDDNDIESLCSKCPLSRIDAVQSYPDNDGGSWYYHPRTGEMVIVRE